MANLDLPTLESLRELADDSHVRSRFLRTWILILAAHILLIALLFKFLLPQLERIEAAETARDFASQEVNWISTTDILPPPPPAATADSSATAPESLSKPILYADSKDPEHDPESDIALPIRPPEPRIAPNPEPPAPTSKPTPLTPKLQEVPAPASTPVKTTAAPEPVAQPSPQPLPPAPARPRLTPAPAPKAVVTAKPLPKLSPAPQPVPTPTPAAKPVLKPAPTPKPVLKPAVASKPVLKPADSPKPVLKATPLPAPSASASRPSLNPAPIAKAFPVAAPGPVTASRTEKPAVLAPAPASAAPGQGSRASAGEKEDLSWYHRLIHDAFHGNWRQPQSVQAGGKIYSTKMKIVIRKDGTIAHTSMVKGSGNEVVDQSVTAAAGAVRRIAPLPKTITSDTYTVYINFELK